MPGHGGIALSVLMGRAIRIDGATCFPPYPAVPYRYSNITSRSAVNAYRGSKMNPKHDAVRIGALDTRDIAVLQSAIPLVGDRCGTFTPLFKFQVKS